MNPKLTHSASLWVATSAPMVLDAKVPVELRAYYLGGGALDMTRAAAAF